MDDKTVYVGSTPVNCPSCGEDKKDMLESQGPTVSGFNWFFCNTCSALFGIHPDSRSILSSKSQR